MYPSTSPLELALQQYSLGFSPIVPLLPNEKILRLDFAEGETLFGDTPLDQPEAMEQAIQQLLQQKNLRYAAGGYGVLRNIYARSSLFNAPTLNAHPRRFHIGCDIFGASHTPVFAPLDGSVHSFADNQQLGDYGPTIILQHRLSKHISFYTLYGHLSRASLENLQVDKFIAQGEPFAQIGTVGENGQWSPHLHFQIIHHIGTHQGDFPGVCALTDRYIYQQNCPNPEVILHFGARYILP